MRAKGLSKKLGLVGTGIGTALFLIYGISHGALIGGTAGLQAGAVLAGASQVIPRVLGGVGMVLSSISKRFQEIESKLDLIASDRVDAGRDAHNGSDATGR